MSVLNHTVHEKTFGFHQFWIIAFFHLERLKKLKISLKKKRQINSLNIQLQSLLNIPLFEHVNSLLTINCESEFFLNDSKMILKTNEASIIIEKEYSPLELMIDKS